MREEVATFVHQYQGIRALPGRLRTHLGKWEGMFCRYCLVLHLIDAAYQGEVFDGEISGDVARRVWRLFMDYFWPHALVFYSDIADRTDIMEGARWVGGYILERNLMKIARRDVQQGYRAVRHDQVLLSAIMDALVTYGWLSPVIPKQYQRDITGWAVNPQVHDLFKDRAQHEREHRQREREAIARAVEKFRSDRAVVDTVACAHGEGFSKSE